MKKSDLSGNSIFQALNSIQDSPFKLERLRMGSNQSSRGWDREGVTYFRLYLKKGKICLYFRFGQSWSMKWGREDGDTSDIFQVCTKNGDNFCQMVKEVNRFAWNGERGAALHIEIT